MTPARPRPHGASKALARLDFFRKAHVLRRPRVGGTAGGTAAD